MLAQPDGATPAASRFWFAMEQRPALAASELLRLVRSGRMAHWPPYSRLLPSRGDEALRALHLSRLLRFVHVLTEDDETVEDVHAQGETAEAPPRVIAAD